MVPFHCHFNPELFRRADHESYLFSEVPTFSVIKCTYCCLSKHRWIRGANRVNGIKIHPLSMVLCGVVKDFQ